MLSEGRSGSSVLCEGIAALTRSPSHLDHGMGNLHNLAHELLGSDRKSMENQTDPISEMSQWFSSICEWYPTSGVIGFKMKPYFNISTTGQFSDPKWAASFVWMRQSNMSIVYNHRQNLLDKVISDFAFVDQGHNGTVRAPAHCRADDSACIAQRHEQRVKLPTGKWLVHILREHATLHASVLAFLEQSGLRYTTVTYEQLLPGTAGSTAAWLYWQRLLHFLRPAKAPCRAHFSNITSDDVAAALQITAQTTARHQEDRVENFADVVQTLLGTEFESQLHR